MSIWAEFPWLATAVKAFLAALFAPVWWPLLVDIRAEIVRTADPSGRGAAARSVPRRAAPIPFLARLHGQADTNLPHPAAPLRGTRGARRATATVESKRASSPRRAFRATKLRA